MGNSNSTPPQQRKHILCFGRLHFEVTIKQLEFLPARRIVYRSPDISIAAAGAGFTTSTVLQRMGSECTVAGVLGDDWQGDAFQSLLARSGVTNCVARAPEGSTGVNVLAVDSRGLVKYVVSSASDEHFPHSTQAIIESGWPYDWMHLGNANLFAARHPEEFSSFLKQVRLQRPNITISADSTKSSEYAAATTEIAPFIDVLFCNESEAQEATQRAKPEDCASALIDCGVRKAVIIKRGPNGAYWKTHADDDHEAGYQVRRNTYKNVVGTGDVFCAAAVHCLANGQEISSAIDTANLVAAFQIHSHVPICDLPSVDSAKLKELRKLLPRLSSRTPAASATSHANSNDAGVRYDAGRPLSTNILQGWLEAIGQQGLVTKDSILLDAGCGTGRFAIPIAERFGCKVLAVDRNPSMLELARRKSTPADIDWIQEEFETIEDSIGDYVEKIDCIWTSSVVEELVAFDPERLIRQFFRLLKSGGKLLIRTTAPELVDRIEIFDFFQQAYNDVRSRALAVPELWGIAIAAGFVPSNLQLFDDSEQMSVDAYIARIKKRSYVWSDVYDDEQFDLHLKEYRKYLEEFGATSCHDHRPTYLLCLGRP